MPHKIPLVITTEEKNAIKNIYGKSNTDIADDVNAIKIWLTKQPHLPQQEDDVRLEKMLLLNKFSVEKTKKKLDLYYTVRTLVPEYFESRDPLSHRLQNLMDTIMLFPLPHLTQDFGRIFVMRLISDDPDKFDLDAYSKYFFAICDLRLVDDYYLHEYFIVDMAHMKLGHVVKFTPVFVTKMYKVIQKAFSDRIKSIHFLNLPSYARPLVQLCNSILSEKLANRIFVHKNVESLHEQFNKNILPSDYSGNLQPLSQLFGEWRQYFESKSKWIVEQSYRSSNEKLRLEDSVDYAMFGLAGSFRQLNID